jgi:hypothetical protein
VVTLSTATRNPAQNPTPQLIADKRKVAPKAFKKKIPVWNVKNFGS